LSSAELINVIVDGGESTKTVSRRRLKIADVLARHSVSPWPEVRDGLN
jgi:hypothetical protein